MRKIAFACLTAALFVPGMATAGNWSHWRGDDGNGVATDATPPTRWSDTENVKWKVEIPGKGSGSPIIWEDKVYVVTAVQSGGAAAPTAAPQPRQGGRSRGGRGPAEPLRQLAFKLLCFDRATGALNWQQTAVTATPHQGTHSTNGFASASPCTDGQHVYAHFGSRGLYCYSMDGKLQWKRDDFGPMETRASFGEGSSPTLEGEHIIVPWDHEGDSALFLLDKRTGKTVWRVARDEPTCWATPLVVEHRGRKQIVMNGQNFARSYDFDSGKELWRCGGQTQRPVASPVSAGNLVYVGSGFRGSFLGAFQLDGSGDIEGTKDVEWTINRDTPDIGSLLLSSGRLYFHKEKTGMLSCVDATTGESHYGPKRISALSSIYASPIAAAGHVYLTGRRGTTVVIKDSDEFEIVSTNSVGETVDATPAPADNQLFIRGERHLFCIEG